jgi:hypothetical protein
VSAEEQPAIDPRLRRASKWIALLLFILYCVDLVWKLAHWSQYSAGLKTSTIVFALAIRLVFMAFLFWIYLRARKTS